MLLGPDWDCGSSAAAVARAALLRLWFGQLCCRPPPAGRRGRTPRDRPSGTVKRCGPAVTARDQRGSRAATAGYHRASRRGDTHTRHRFLTDAPDAHKKRRPLPERPPKINNQRHVALMNARLLPRNQVGNYRLQLTTTFSATNWILCEAASQTGRLVLSDLPPPRIESALHSTALGLVYSNQSALDFASLLVSGGDRLPIRSSDRNPKLRVGYQKLTGRDGWLNAAFCSDFNYGRAVRGQRFLKTRSDHE